MFRYDPVRPGPETLAPSAAQQTVLLPPGSHFAPHAVILVMVAGKNLPGISLLHLGHAIEFIVSKVSSVRVNPAHLHIGHVPTRVVDEIAEGIVIPIEDVEQLIALSVIVRDQVRTRDLERAAIAVVIPGR